MVPESSQDDAETLEGTVTRVVFHAEDTGYKVARLETRDGDVVTVVGHGGAVDEGTDVSLAGRWTTHPTYGRQFQYRRATVRPPRTEDQLVRRLQRYPGIGPHVAERIVRRFGLATLDVIEREPRRLEEVRGLGRKTVDRIVAYHREHTGPKAAIEARLSELGVSVRFAAPIHRRFGAEALDVLTRDPYVLAREIEGIGFVTADRIARAQGIEPEHPGRIEAGILHVLERAEGEGHCALPAGALVAEAEKLLSVDRAYVVEGFERLRRSGHLVVEEDGTAPEQALVFRLPVVRAERTVAEAIAAATETPVEPWRIVRLPEHLSEGQRAAVASVAAHRFTVLTGGPGTGKSTVVRHVIETAEANETDVLLCAPTGRAAKRLEAATDRPASTIHRLLEVDPATGRFRHGPDEPLPPGLLVVDEASMLDIFLARSLFAALGPEHRVLLVGDADQLPSVGPGNVLRDVLTAAEAAPDRLPVVALTEIFRQAEGSSIVANAHRILAGERPVSDPSDGDGQFFVILARGAEHVREQIVRLATERIPAAFGLDPRSDVQVLVPMHRGAAGTVELNRELQSRLADEGPEVRVGTHGDRVFRVGDRVLQTRNDYGKGVFNGDVGTVVRVDPDAGTLVVDMEDQRVAYGSDELGALQLAYAMSIHKSQGSEFPAVVVGLAVEHHVMLRRNLLYTAVTRARDLCVVVAEPRALARALMRADAARRYTGLVRRLERALGIEPHFTPVHDP
ncbi:MAG: ATP-dependent RecD-like DNA helicase [Deltaproteobacteria bacterium]|nr:MAG: ATP-dependent RecD-like DNA helicase [Deltaproteobacteria bacterium]